MNWESSTVINREEIGEYLYKVKGDGKDIKVDCFSVKIKPSGFDVDGLCDYLGRKFSYFVFPEDEIKEMREDDKSPHRRASKKLGVGSNYKSEAGILGEILLFFIVEGFYDCPMVSHKILHKQDKNVPVLGADGVFIGEHNGETGILLGEAKTVEDLGNAIRKALESISEFHGSSSQEEIENELNVAPNRLSDNLDDEHYDKITEIFTIENYRDYPLVHPIFICYQEESIEGVDRRYSKTQAEQKIEETLSCEGYLDRINRSFGDETEKAKRADILFIFLPLSEFDDFRKKGLKEIVPGYKPLIESFGENKRGRS